MKRFDNPTPAQFWDMLDSHDWHYPMTDDGATYRTGAENAKHLRTIAAEKGGIYQELLDGFLAYADQWQDSDAKPERPAEEGAAPNLVDQIIQFESGEMEEDEVIDFFQTLVDTGMAWTLQGSYGRTAQSLIDAGEITV